VVARAACEIARLSASGSARILLLALVAHQLRIGESNSIANGGVFGICDTMAGAIWTLDMALRAAWTGMHAVASSCDDVVATNCSGISGCRGADTGVSKLLDRCRKARHAAYSTASKSWEYMAGWTTPAAGLVGNQWHGGDAGTRLNYDCNIVDSWLS